MNEPQVEWPEGSEGWPIWARTVWLILMLALEPETLFDLLDAKSVPCSEVDPNWFERAVALGVVRVIGPGR
jgi:hypothetical protein